jgi:hypothetical protein
MEDVVVRIRTEWDRTRVYTVRGVVEKIRTPWMVELKNGSLVVLFNSSAEANAAELKPKVGHIVSARCWKGTSYTEYFYETPQAWKALSFTVVDPVMDTIQKRAKLYGYEVPNLDHLDDAARSREHIRILGDLRALRYPARPAE